MSPVKPASPVTPSSVNMSWWESPVPVSANTASVPRTPTVPPTKPPSGAEVKNNSQSAFSSFLIAPIDDTALGAVTRGPLSLTLSPLRGARGPESYFATLSLRSMSAKQTVRLRPPCLAL
jgi:hypothetical protein